MGPVSTNGKIVGVIFFAGFLDFCIRSLSLSLSLSFSLSLSRSLSFSLSLSLHRPLSLSLSTKSRSQKRLSLSLSLSLSLIIIYTHICAWQSADGRVTSDHCRVTVQRLFSKSFPNRLKRPKNVVWQSADGRVTSTTVAWPFSDFFQNFPKSLETSKKRCLTVGRRSRDLRPLSRDRSATFFKIFPNRLKRPKNVVWQSADGRVTSTTVAWPFSDFFQNFPKSLETSKKRCLTVGRQSRDLLPLSRDRSATFFKKISNCLKRPKNVVWQSADGRVTSTTVAWPFSDFFQNFPKSLETS